MKIAILTLPLNTNYGGILQAYALQTILQRMGHEVEVLYRHQSIMPPVWKMPLIIGKRLIGKFLKKNKYPIFYEYIETYRRRIIRQNIDKFIHKYIKLKKIRAIGSLQPEEIDAFVVGSDQVWRRPYFCVNWRTSISDSFLAFSKNWNIKRLSYAASFGIDNIEKEYTKEDIEKSAKALKKFDAISVRESSGVDICRDIFGVDAVHVLDPTMLLSKEDYIELIIKKGVPKSNGNLFSYILDPTDFKKTVIDKVASDRNLSPFSVAKQPDDWHLPLEDRIQPPVEEWLRGFMDADFVVTDSFHACVFSIIFGKPFLAIGNKDRGMSRFKSLLKQFDLENCLIKEDEPKFPKEIDYLQMYSKLNVLKVQSEQFLINSLYDY